MIEAGTSAPIAFARVALVAGDSSTTGTTTTDPGGYFVLDAPSAGSYLLTTERLGYALRQDAMTFGAGEVVEVVLSLAPEGIPLPPIEVRARGGMERGRFGFERRSAFGRGVFLTADSIAARDPAVATDAFRSVPGVVNLNDHVYSMSGGRCLVVYMDHRLSPVQVGSRPNPRALARFGMPKPPDMLNLITDVDRIRGIEVYRDLSEVPDELRTAMRMQELAPVDRPLGREPCGLVWVWTDVGW